MKQCAGSGDAQVPSKILTAVALVCAQAFHRGGHLLAQVTESIVAANRQPERQNVDCHGRRLECRATYARHEWHRDDNIRLAEQSVEKRAVAGDQCLGPRCSRRVCHVFEAVEGVGGNDLANLDRSFRRTGDLLAASVQRGQRRQDITPVVTIFRELLASPVRLVLADQICHRTESRWCDVGSLLRGRVVRGDTTRNHGCAVAVDDQVVIELDAPDLAIGEPDQRVRVQRTLHHQAAVLGRPAALGVDQCVRHGYGIALVTDVGDRDDANRLVGDVLTRAVRRLDHPQPHGFGFTDRRRDGSCQQFGVDRFVTRDFEHLADEVAPRFGIKPLCVPNPELSSCESKRSFARRSGVRTWKNAHTDPLVCGHTSPKGDLTSFWVA